MVNEYNTIKEIYTSSKNFSKAAKVINRGDTIDDEEGGLGDILIQCVRAINLSELNAADKEQSIHDINQEDSRSVPVYGAALNMGIKANTKNHKDFVENRANLEAVVNDTDTPVAGLRNVLTYVAPKEKISGEYREAAEAHRSLAIINFANLILTDEKVPQKAKEKFKKNIVSVVLNYFAQSYKGKKDILKFVEALYSENPDMAVRKANENLKPVYETKVNEKITDANIRAYLAAAANPESANLFYQTLIEGTEIRFEEEREEEEE